MAVNVSPGFLAELEAAEAPVATETWNPGEGELIVGPLQDVRIVNTQYGEKTVITVTDQHGFFGTVDIVLNSVLQKQYDNLQPMIGETIGIKYLGQQISQSTGNTYKNYVLKVDRPDAAQPRLAGTQAAKPAAKPAAVATADNDIDPFAEE